MFLETSEADLIKQVTRCVKELRCWLKIFVVICSLKNCVHNTFIMMTAIFYVTIIIFWIIVDKTQDIWISISQL